MNLPCETEWLEHNVFVPDQKETIIYFLYSEEG